MDPAPFNHTIDNTSPLFVYEPNDDGLSPANGWVTWFSQSGFNTAAGEEAIGDSRHITSLAGASVSLQFHGAAIWIFGNASFPFEFTIDGLDPVLQSPLTTPDPDDVLLALGLPLDTHLLTITARPSQSGQGELFFDKVIITDALPLGAASTIPIVIDNQNRTALHYQGNWTTENNDQIPSHDNPKPFMSTQDPTGSVALNFTGALAVAVNGSRNLDHSTYNVSLNGASKTYNASTIWSIGDSVLFYQSGLDPQSNYTIEMINAPGGLGGKMTINDITLYTPSNATSTDSSQAGSTSTSSPTNSPTITSHKNHVAVIVGPVVGVVGGLLFIIIGFFLWRKRFRSKPVVQDETKQPTPSTPELSASDQSMLKL
ncbi:hypothetical protein ABKN59_002705 [Abortiporus biennis]